MQIGFTRALIGLAVVGLFFMGGCRSTTDRMRVLEAEKADLSNQNKELTHQVAELRAKQLQAEAEVEREKARADAALARAQALESSRPRDPLVAVDVENLKKQLGGTGVLVKEREDGGASILLASDVTFKSGRADLSKQALSILRRVATAVNSIDGVRTVRVEGHTDSDPIRKSGWKSNEELSLARAKMVRQFLVTQGVTEDFISVAGHGAAKPLESNKTDEGKARNRRVEIILLSK